MWRWSSSLRAKKRGMARSAPFDPMLVGSALDIPRLHLAAHALFTAQRPHRDQ